MENAHFTIMIIKNIKDNFYITVKKKIKLISDQDTEL
jgi:hypothetical protein